MQTMTPSMFQVERLKRETQDTFTLQLSSANGGKTFEFRPGQFNMLYVFGIGEIPISISSDPSQKDAILHTTRKVGMVTHAMGQLKKGDMLGLRGPFGSSWPVDTAEGKDVVMVAGGIGLAPLRPAIYHIGANRKKYRKVVLLYGARMPEEMLFTKELAKWSSHYDIEIHTTVDRATRAWKGNVGVVPHLIPRAPFDTKKTVAMICGPEIMMRFTVEDLRRRGMEDSGIFISMERNMKCAVGFCGHCQFGPHFICKDGPVFRFDHVRSLFGLREI